MISIIGIIVVFGAVIGGFMMEKGQLAVLVQPAELVTIGGAALGTLLVANPMHILKGIASGLMGVIGGSPFTKQRYLDTLKMMFDLFSKARKDGMVAIEADVEGADKSPIFTAYPKFMKDHHAVDFVCDTMRMAITGGVLPFDVDQMMELDMDTHHHSSSLPTTALNTVADALPGLGIVAAVLGIVITMGALGGPPEEIGHKVAAALVGTFLGILLCYGVLGPLASFMGKMNEEEHAYYHILRVVMLAFIKGTSPILAVELARRAIPAHLRPSFSEVEKACRNKSAAPAAA
ncbi:flagellar motor stator protein MotA [Granulicella tundricola]|uniref:Chemotaxis protein n=1 Tax=Granulicella tundricola (strain ATCC BAA-1859 / DSM 23138 / MP5ACTX9) TaxID=1198114 RepID=E8X653_GRATM|nr:flagellar motor stator protein MotA [Granulicella tundricola]ADW70937.1 chemotaxis protein [Granulicella tundricola MP5ACTX9]